MPELPDITVYLDALRTRIEGEILQEVRVGSPFLLRTFEPPLESTFKRRVVELRRLGKRIAIGLEGDFWLVIHLMIAGRLQWKAPNAKLTSKIALAAFDFPQGTLLLTEAGSKRRASLHVLAGEDQLQQHNPPGVDVLAIPVAVFQATLQRENHTLKRALTDPSLFSGIGNAYSDEILHKARLSPFALTSKLTQDEILQLHGAVVSTLQAWIDRLRAETGTGFPTGITAFREGMAVHGRFGKSCPDCGAPVQRIRYADNETNYCARCQTDGRVLADRSLSRLLKDDWPRSIDEWE